MLSRDEFAGQSGNEAADVVMGAIIQAEVGSAEGKIEEGAIECPGFDEGKRYLGKLCPKGHEWGNTGKSLRQITSYGCVECSKICRRKGEREKFIKKADVSVLTKHGDDPTIFRLGLLCKNNHDYHETGKSLRRLGGNDCVECSKALAKIWRIDNPRYDKSLSGIWSLGDLCKYDHDYEGSGKSMRRLSDNECVECQRVRNLLYSRKPEIKQRRQMYGAAYHQRAEVKARLKSYWSVFWRTAEGKQKARKARVKRRARKAENHSSPYSYVDLQTRFDLFDGHCAYCGKVDRLEADHFISISKGGSDSIGNLIPACDCCNSKKGKKDPYEWFSQEPFFLKSDGVLF